MSKLKAAPFIFMATILHLAIGAAIEYQIGMCDTHVACVTPLLSTLERIFGFPLSEVMTRLRPEGDVEFWTYPVNSLVVASVLYLIVKWVSRWSQAPNVKSSG